MSGLIEGQTYEVWYPFKRETYQPPPVLENPGAWISKYIDQPAVQTWAPGWESEAWEYGQTYNWHGNGAMILTVVSLHKPGPTYPERAFYTRQWRDPDGKVFGRTNLRVISSRALVNWLHGSRTAHLESSREEVELDWPEPLPPQAKEETHD